MGAPPYPAEFPGAEPDYQRDERGSAGGGGRGVLGVDHYGEAGVGPEPGDVRGAGKRHFEDELGAESADQAGGKTGAGMERRGGRTEGRGPSAAGRAVS